jgi:hypothetical protein
MGQKGCPERSINNYQHVLLNPSEDRKPQMHRVENITSNTKILGYIKIILYRRKCGRWANGNLDIKTIDDVRGGYV